MSTTPAAADQARGQPGGHAAKVAGVSASDAGPYVKLTYYFTRRSLRKLTGRAPERAIEPLQMYAHVSGLLRGYAKLEQATAGLRRFDKRLRALAELKAATLTQCEYCIDMGSRIALGYLGDGGPAVGAGVAGAVGMVGHRVPQQHLGFGIQFSEDPVDDCGRCWSFAFVSWEISANLGRHERPGVDARGWLWTITRGDQAARVVIEISGTAWSSDPLRLPEDTRQALETDGRTELLKILDQDDPPRVIHCGLTGCSYLSAADVRGQTEDP